ncbi:MAG: DNA primase [Patescibacteria group bacterium]
MDSVAEIKSRLSIVDVVSQYVQLKKAGRNFKACCPFHSEKTPSFIISPERQFAWCYGCQTGGDIFRIVELIEGVDFKEALKILADKAGVELPAYSAGGVKKEKRERLIEINEAAADFFVGELGKNSMAQDYLKGRGLLAETIKEWCVGYAPDGYENLFPELEKKFAKKEIVEAGVAGVKEMASDQLFDKFRSRIIFPIEDHRGRVVAFTGRILGDGEPKYLNSSESPIFTKGAILFGFSKARDAIRGQKFAVLVEGQLDVISTHQAGFGNVVASSGTALTEQHLASLKNLVESVTFCFDSDNAGIDSTVRALELSASADVSAKVAVLPEGIKDPDEAIRQDPQIFADAVAGAVTPLEFFFTKVFAKADLGNAAEKKKVAREALSYAQKIASAVEREEFSKKLSVKLGTSEAALEEEFENLPQLSQSSGEELRVEEKFGTEDFLLGLVLAFPKVAGGIAEDLKKIHCSKYGELWKKLKDANFAEQKKLEDRFEKLALLASDRYADFGDIAVKKEMLALVKKLSRNSLSDKKQKLKAQMREAEEAGDEEKAAELSGKYQKLLKRET